MAEDDLRKGSNLKKFIENLIGIKESDVNPNIAPSMFGDEIEKKFSTQSTLTDVEPVGKLREKTTGAKFSKTGKTFYGVANTKDAIKIAAQYGYGKGDFIPAEVINKYPDLAEAIQGSRPIIEKDLKAGFTLPDPIKGESFDDYYKRVKAELPTAQSMIALENQVRKNYKAKFPEYADVTKTVDFQERGLLDFDPNAEKVKGLQIPSGKNEGIRKIVTEQLESNLGYIPKENRKAIDTAIEEFVDSMPQKDFDKFTVDLLGEVDPETKKPYTKNKVKKMLSNRVVFAASKYFNQAVTPEIVDEVMKSIQGSQGAYNVGTIAENALKKIKPQKIGAFTTALVSLIKSGQASDLLTAGTKASGLGLLLEVPFMQEAEAADLFTKDELSELAIAEKFGGIESLQKKEAEMLEQKELENIKRKEERDYDVYERIGEPGFLEYFFSLGKAGLNK